MKPWIAGALVLAVAAVAMLHPPLKQAVVTAAPPLPVSHRRPPRGVPVPSPAVVYVAGAVRRPGIYRLAPGSRAFAALALAGGFRPEADPAGINLAQIVSDGEELAVPALGERKPARPRQATRSRGAASKQPPATPIDLNAADAAALMQLPGVGRALAERIVQFRDANGPFASVDELADVAGITPRRLEALANALYVK